MMKKRNILGFVAITYGISWICWLPIIKFIPLNLSESPKFVIFFFVIGVYSPTISAILCSAVIGGWPTVKALIKKYILWRVGILWYIAAILFFPLVYVLSLFSYKISFISIGSIQYGVLPIIPVLIFVSIFLGPLGEELGWRGFLLPFLERKYGVIKGSIVIGITWTFWHAPLFWAKSGTAISGYPVTFLSVTIYLLFITGASFIFTWLYSHTNGSILLSILLHLSMNASGLIVSLLIPDIGLEGKLNIFYFSTVCIWVLILCGLGFDFIRKIASKRQIKT
jgi:membrane protease YdiL (CAAX protease family)